MRIKFISLLFLSAASLGAASLSEAYTMALENNSELKQSLYEAQAASERTSSATAYLLPSISLDANYVMEKYRRRGATNRTDESYLKYGINLNQSLLRVPAWYERSLAKVREESSNLQYQNTKQELAKKVAQAYFAYAYDKQSLSVAKSYEQASKARYERMQKSLDMGLANKMDTLESKVRLDEASLEVARAKRRIELSRLSLARLVGQEIDVANFSELDVDFFRRESLDKFENVEANFDYKQAKLGREYYEKDYSKRVSEYLPSVDFSIGYFNHNYRDDRYFPDELNKVEGMVKFTLPLYSGGGTKARVEEGRLMRLASAEKEADARREIAIKQRQAMSDYLGYISEYDIAKSSLEHSLVYEHSIERGYEEGLKNLVDLLDAKARVFKTQNDALAAAHKLILSYIELYSDIGEISEDVMARLSGALR
ncbi:TolC family protein [Campylobacter sp. 19-13652]|uniref:TolC family protein n=1 Tax=Campylobacter sp. 19-13652 TaxID=2840180 RepID=UPI001C743218|nr:TolC family protein [Campylobacter sp. 19-13652]BCX79787.1 outer membrane protein TolC [Campylobacter sp. 19-13652]